MKPDKNEIYLFCGISKEGMKPAIEIDHQGKTNPIEKASSPVAIIETINFFMCLKTLI